MTALPAGVHKMTAEFSITVSNYIFRRLVEYYDEGRHIDTVFDKGFFATTTFGDVRISPPDTISQSCDWFVIPRDYRPTSINDEKIELANPDDSVNVTIKRPIFRDAPQVE